MQTSSTVVADRILPRSRALSVALIVTFAALTAILAQVRIPLWFTPVPITGQTFAVILSGLALGWRLAATSQTLYIVLGAAGLPVFQGGEAGWSYVTGPTLGYLVGFVVAAATVGFLTRRNPNPLGALGATAAGTVVIYLFGVPWLATSLGVTLPEALALGVVPFLLGDAAKTVLAAAVSPLLRG